ncbi:hypothetical protein FHH43_15300, partial [Clostridium perfringens]|nr:hypothetical protein [Clostridium perfringens]
NFNLLIKPHPMDSIRIDKSKFKNIKIAYNDNLEYAGVNIYTILKMSKALITDYSSVYIDYLILDKPIGFVVDDIREYSDKRGFVFEDPFEKMPGEKIVDIDTFINFIEEIVKEKDSFKFKRNSINRIFNEFNTSKSCRYIAEKAEII